MKGMIGTTVGAYRITARLSEGGMGSVWTATHTVMAKDAVIKFLLPELSNDEAMVRRFFNEAKAAASIHDPGIVNVFDVGTLPDGRAFIVMEKLRGQSLSDRLRAGRMRVENAAVVLRLLSRSLEQAHANGIVHRDLKPDNIFLVPDRDMPGGERTKILDFGIAKLAERGATMATRAGSIFGTPAYMAPEQCSDASMVDPRADLYALGCIAYEMVSGAPPFGQGGLDVLAAHLRDEPPPLAQRVPGIHPGFAAIVHRLLRKEPNERYGSAGELVTAIDSLRLPPPGVADGMTIASSVPPHGPTTPAPAPYSYPPPSAAPQSYPPPAATSYPPPPSAHPALTTHGAAAGMMTSQPPRSSGGPARWWLGVVGGVVVAGGIAIAVIASTSGGGGGTRAGTGTFAENLVLAQKAMADERWDDALMASMNAFAQDKTSSEASQLMEKAKQESSHALAFRKMQKSSSVNDYPALVAAYKQIADDSVYHARATELRAQEQAEWLDDEIPPAIEAARRGDCADHSRRLAMMETHVPPGEPRLNAIRDCHALGKTAAVVDAGVADATVDAAPTVAVVTPPDRGDRTTKRDRTRGDKPGSGSASASGATTGSATRPPPPPDPPDDGPMDPDEAITEAKNAIKAKQYRRGLTLAEAALRKRPGDAEAQMFATIAACGLDNVAKARAHLPRARSSYRDIALERCLGMGHSDIDQ
jgi:serine/threonine protein kinase